MSFSSVSTEVKAWVNFNGTGTVAIRGRLNVSSITDNGTGDYTVNFTNAMSDANYAFSVDSRESESGTLAWGAYGTATRVAQTTTTFRILYATYGGGGTLYDASALCLAIFR